jgi:transposase
MLSVVWNPNGFQVIKVLPRGCKSTSQYDIDNIVPQIRTLQFAEDRRKLVIHADNARRHVSTRIKQYMEDDSLRTEPYPPYSPDLAPSDFFFRYVKRSPQRSEFQHVEELWRAVVRILNAIPTDTLIGTFHEWIKRLEACIDNGGEYVESRLFSSKKFSLGSTHYRDAQAA